MASTVKVCPDIAIDESEFLQVFELADNYIIRNDTLNLNIGRRAPLAPSAYGKNSTAVIAIFVDI